MAQLREAKKQRTRRAITDVAATLFLERGFDETTIADVAEAAGVAKMTVTNYFPRKEDLFFDMHDEVILGPARAFADRPDGVSVLDAVRAYYLRAAADRDRMLGLTDAATSRLIDRSPVLRARLREIFDHQEQALAVVLAEAVGESPDAFTPRLVAAQLTSVLRLLWGEAQRQVRAGTAEAELPATLERTARAAFARLEPSLDGYGVRHT
ncbi:TetR family transcriptional regulator [Actinacidiphila yeochonensis]|uniref:TetR family transcriptional regulator n=1 Tax=Actinacidiphila yeochonensis TaxID=89050 RepID=UPI00056AF4DD|nr:TetR family transcriptional regulator [Actinacidiphila yeochonensis]